MNFINRKLDILADSLRRTADQLRDADVAVFDEQFCDDIARIEEIARRVEEKDYRRRHWVWERKRLAKEAFEARRSALHVACRTIEKETGVAPDSDLQQRPVYELCLRQFEQWIGGRDPSATRADCEARLEVLHRHELVAFRLLSHLVRFLKLWARADALGAHTIQATLLVILQKWRWAEFESVEERLHKTEQLDREKILMKSH